MPRTRAQQQKQAQPTVDRESRAGDGGHDDIPGNVGGNDGGEVPGSSAAATAVVGLNRLRRAAKAKTKGGPRIRRSVSTPVLNG